MKGFAGQQVATSGHVQQCQLYMVPQVANRFPDVLMLQQGPHVGQSGLVAYLAPLQQPLQRPSQVLLRLVLVFRATLAYLALVPFLLQWFGRQAIYGLLVLLVFGALVHYLAPLQKPLHGFSRQDIYWLLVLLVFHEFVHLVASIRRHVAANH